MVLKSFTHYKHSTPQDMPSGSFYSERIGFWADVKEVDSVNGRVDVVNDQGLKLSAIPVCSGEWVIDKEKYVSGERHLPPEGARVFVLTPTGTLNGAFVLCSGYPRGEKSLQTLFAQNNNEEELKKNQYERITQGGWDIKENYEDGNISLSSNDGNIVIQINPAKNDNLKQEQTVSISAYKNTVEITKDGIKFTDANKNNISATSNGLSVKDKNSNKITTASGGITLEDCNGNKIEMTTTSVIINGNLEVLR